MDKRLILHIDINSFYAQVELLTRPELRLLPVAVGGDVKQRHGVVLAKNEAAKAFQVQTGESLFEAKQKCPNLIVLPPHFDLYSEYSRRAKQIFLRYSDRVESFGPDEAWVDLTHLLKADSRLHGLSWSEAALNVATMLKTVIYDELSLTVSIGVSWNKAFAKLGSDYRKPDAITIISPENYRDIVWPLPVSSLLYVGPVSRKRLADTGILTIGQLAKADEAFLQSILGKSGPELGQMARGDLLSPVLTGEEQRPRQSVGVSRTMSSDIVSLEAAKPALKHLAVLLNERLVEQNLRGQVLHIFIRDNQFRDKTRQRSLSTAIQATDDLYDEAFSLLEMHEDFRLPLRALGISVSSLLRVGEAWQPSLFDLMKEQSETNVKREKLEETLNNLHSRYGSAVVDFGDILFGVTDTEEDSVD